MGPGWGRRAQRSHGAQFAKQNGECSGNSQYSRLSKEYCAPTILETPNFQPPPLSTTSQHSKKHMHWEHSKISLCAHK